MRNDAPLADKLVKLPVWAQTYIDDLRRQLRASNALRDAAAGASGPEDTDTVWNHRPLTAGEPEVRLPKGERVTFIIGPDRVRDYIQVRVEEGWSDRTRQPVLSLMGYRGIVMLPPQASNVLQFRLAQQ